jgi:undecaprenyl-diphosphatase
VPRNEQFSNVWQSKARVALFALASLLSLWGFAQFVCPQDVCRVTALDWAGEALLSALRTPGLIVVFQVLTWLGSVWVLLPLALWFYWHQRAQGRIAAFVPLCLLSSTVASHLIKWLIQRPRPEGLVGLTMAPWDTSFPSAHTMQATAFFLSLCCQPNRRPDMAPLAAALTVVTMVAVSRVVLHVHFVSDVLAGAMAATFWVLAVRSHPFWQGDRHAQQIPGHR